MELGSTPPFWWSSQISTPQNRFSDVNIEVGVNYPPIPFIMEKMVFPFFSVLAHSTHLLPPKTVYDGFRLAAFTVGATAALPSSCHGAGRQGGHGRGDPSECAVEIQWYALPRQHIHTHDINADSPCAVSSRQLVRSVGLDSIYQNTSIKKPWGKDKDHMRRVLAFIHIIAMTLGMRHEDLGNIYIFQQNLNCWS